MTRITAHELAHCFDTRAAGLVLYARQVVGKETAEDVVQEAFIKLAAQNETPANVRAWLIRCVRNASLDALRTAKNRRTREQRREQWFQHSVEAPIEASELQAALAKLPSDQREVIVLRIWNGATFDEIAELTKTPLSSIYARYRNALKQLRTHWEVPCPKD